MLVSEFPALSETFILDQILGLLDRGHSVSILASRKSKNSLYHAAVYERNLLSKCEFAYSDGLLLFQRAKTIARLALLTPAYPRLSQVWRRLFSGGSSRLLEANFVPLLSGRKSFDVLHCQFGNMALVGTLLRQAGLFSAPIVATFHGSDITSQASLRRREYQQLMSRFELCTVSTNFLKSRVMAFGAKQEQIRKLPMGIDLSVFHCRDFERPRDKKIRILSVCRLVEVKGVEFGIRAVAKLAKEIPDLEFYIVGDGPLEPELRQLAIQLGVHNQVHFLGRQTREQVIDLYNKCDIYLYSGIVTADGAEEGQGVVVIEAQAMGMPVVATRVGGVPETLQENRSGILVDPGDVDGLATSLKYLSQNPQIWPAMGSAGRAFVQANYDLNKLNNQLVNIYSEAIAQYQR